MTEDKIIEFHGAYHTAFIDKQCNSNLAYKPQLVYNDNKEENLKAFSRDYFEACIYDEAHHTSADSYKKVMDYFEPSFTLGMTATPDKRDDNIEGRNIYEIFDHNIAYEIRGHTSGRVFPLVMLFFWLKL